MYIKLPDYTLKMQNNLLIARLHTGNSKCESKTSKSITKGHSKNKK